MTPDNRQPRKRRRHRRRPGGTAGAISPGADGNSIDTLVNGNVAYPNGGGPQQFPGGGGGGRRRRRSRRRNRGGGGGGMAPGAEILSTAPLEIPSGELIPTSGVLWVKPNGNGVLVQPANNYVDRKSVV